MTSLVFACLALLQEPVPPATRTAAPTRDQSKQALENHKKAAPRLPMPPDDPNGGALARVNNGRFRAYYIMPYLRETPPAAPPGNAPGTGRPPANGTGCRPAPCAARLRYSLHREHHQA